SFYRHTKTGPEPLVQTPLLDTLGPGTGSSDTSLGWSPVSDGAVGYQVQRATDFHSLVPTDTAEGRTKPSDDASMWASDGGWTASQAHNHTPGGTTSYTSGDGPGLQNT